MKIQILRGHVIREYADLSYLLVAWQSNSGFVVKCGEGGVTLFGEMIDLLGEEVNPRCRDLKLPGLC